MTESDEEQESMSGLFTDESYLPKTFNFGEQAITILSLEASSTDYDLTGQIVWPGAQLMSAYICAHGERFKGKRVLELGSGLGLTGLLCARFCPVVMTDHNEIVLKVMRKNVIYQKEVAKEADLHNVDCMMLEWGNQEHVKAILARYSEGFDYVIGADIYILAPALTLPCSRCRLSRWSTIEVSNLLPLATQSLLRLSRLVSRQLEAL